MAFQSIAENPELDPDMVKALKMMLEGPIRYDYIAEQCGVSTGTLWRWRQLPAFKAALTTVKRNILGDTAIKLVLEVDNSVEALIRLRDDVECPAKVQLAASKAIIEYAHNHVSVAEVEADNADIKEQIKNANG